jgi:hypothetical protein
MSARLTVIALVAVLTAMLVEVDSAGACTCAFGLTPKKQLKAADGAFTGRLLSVRPGHDTSEAALRYRVGRVFKGNRRLHRGKVVTVWDEYSGTTCELPRGVGEVYGLFVSRDEGRWTASLCGVVSPRAMRRAARGAARSSGASTSSGGTCAA